MNDVDGTHLATMAECLTEESLSIMYTKDLLNLNLKRSNYTTQHQTIKANMRAVLLDWLADVCETFRLQRKTYYLATDFIDRFLTISHDIPKEDLQLIGITCLFIAAKFEQTYLPRLSDFSYVTGGACTDENILTKEGDILKVLNWNLSRPVTPIDWLNFYLQSSVVENDDDSFSSPPKYCPLLYIKIAKLLDLCNLDITSLNFTPSVLVATAIQYTFSPELASRVSGYNTDTLQSCSEWMTPFAVTVGESEPPQLQTFKNKVSREDLHNIQTHVVNLETFKRVQTVREERDNTLLNKYVI